MPDYFAHRFEHTNFAGPIHTLVQVGAQGVHDIEDALHVDPSQIVLTTMDPDLAKKADDMLKPWRTAGKTARVDHVAVTAKRPKTATSQVQLFQHPTLSCLRKPTGLQTLFPDIIPKRQAKTPTLAISAVLKALPAMPEDRRHMLRLGLTGDEHTLLKAMGNKGLRRFHDIVISLPDIALFDRAPTRETLLEQLYNFGFIPIAQREGGLRGVQECHLIASPHHAAFQACQAADKDRQATQEEQDARIKTLTREKDALHKRLDQITLDARDLEDLRTRYAILMADYEAQSEALRQVQARIEAVLARFET